MPVQLIRFLCRLLTDTKEDLESLYTLFITSISRTRIVPRCPEGPGPSTNRAPLTPTCLRHHLLTFEENRSPIRRGIETYTVPAGRPLPLTSRRLQRPKWANLKGGGQGLVLYICHLILREYSIFVAALNREHIAVLCKLLGLFFWHAKSSPGDNR